MAIQDDEPHPQIPYLQPEIITQILSRLPVKSLLQFRSVSKSWLSFISHPKFIKTHLNISSKNDQNTHQRLFFILVRTGNKIYIEKCNLSPVLNFVSVNLTELDYPMNHPTSKFRSLWIVGSINGLISIAIDIHYTFIWNPTTRISKRLPPSGFESRLGYLIIVYGFGYDESADDYKVVGVFCVAGIKTTKVMVYSLRSDCWRRIGDFPLDCSPTGKMGKFVNGAIHWVAYLKTPVNGSLFLSVSIVSLDLAKETYGEVPQPNYGEGEYALSLDVLGDCLFLLSECSQNHVNVWMMKEYGVRESWTKLAIFPYLNSPNRPILLYMSKEGEILLELGLDILLYDPKTKSSRNANIRDFDVPLGASAYIESLVSPLILE